MENEEKTDKQRAEELKDYLSYNVFSELLKLKLSIKQLAEIHYEITDVDTSDSFRFENKPKGDLQDCDNSLLQRWVNQTTGYSCDDYYGQVYIKVSNNKYLTFNYSC